MAAAIAYYTLFSIAPVMIIAIALAGMIFGKDASSHAIYGALRDFLGDSGSLTVENMVQTASQAGGKNAFAVTVGTIVILVGATGVFNELQSSLNLIWKVKLDEGGTVKTLIRQRLLTFAMVVSIGFLLLVSLVASAGLAAAGKFLTSALPGGAGLWQFINFAFSLGVVTVLFGLIFKILPDVSLHWKDVILGAFVTALLFAVGKLGVGFYLGKSAVTSSFGAAGSLVIVLLWVFYSSCLVLFGAEFTRAYALMYHPERMQDIKGAKGIDKAPPAQTV